jgi:hypothetical protein
LLRRYIWFMTLNRITTPLLLAAGALALSAGTGLAFAGWLDSGARIFMAMAETGLAWCF